MKGPGQTRPLTREVNGILLLVLGHISTTAFEWAVVDFGLKAKESALKWSSLHKTEACISFLSVNRAECALTFYGVSSADKREFSQERWCMPKSSYHSANSLRAFHLLVVTRGVSSTEGSILKRTMVLLIWWLYLFLRQKFISFSVVRNCCIFVKLFIHD